LTFVDSSRQSGLDPLRKGPVRASVPALLQALRRIETVHGLGIKLPAAHVPPSRIAALARFANTVKVIARLPDDRRLATLAEFVHSLEASAHDDALDALGLMLNELFGNAKKADTKARMRALKDLDKAASVLDDACRRLLDPELLEGELRGLVYDSIGRDELVQALDNVIGLVRPDDDVFRQELSAGQNLGDDDVASADGMRFVVPVRSIRAGPNPKYFKRGRGVTWATYFPIKAPALMRSQCRVPCAAA